MSERVKPGIAFGTAILLVVLLLAGPGCSRSKKRAAGVDWKTGLTGGKLVFEDNFERGELGDAWTTEGSTWRIVDGWVHDDAARNAGLWLDRELPERVRIQFKARSDMPTDGSGFRGDLKCEVFARTPSHQGGYILIYGGWENTINTIARLDEHGADRLEDLKGRVVAGKVYEWTIVRTDSTLRWYVDGKPFLAYEDREPIDGRYFGFNNWLSKAYFDDVAIYEL